MITVDILEPDAATLVAELDMDTVVDGSVQDMLEGDSFGQVAVGLESPNRAELTRGRVLRWNGTGDEPFHSIVEANSHVSVADSKSKVPRQITVRGRGIIAQWDDARVGQWPGMDHVEVRYYTRHFNYASPGRAAIIDDTAYEHSLVLDYDSYGQPSNPAQVPPVTWRDPTAMRIWTAAYSGDQRVGTSLFRTRITTTGVQVLRQHVTADDRVLPWVGGVPVLRPPESPEVIWHDTYAASTLLQDDTTYDLVYCCENETSVAGLSIAWLAAAGWLLDGPADALTTDNLAFHSDASSFWALECIDIPTPGWTVPEILDTLLSEWQPSSLTGWEVVDMAPVVDVEWERMRETNFETRRTTGLGVINQLASKAEFATRVVDGTKQVLCFPPGTRGNFHTSPDAPTVGADDLASLAFQWVEP